MQYGWGNANRPRGGGWGHSGPQAWAGTGLGTGHSRSNNLGSPYTWDAGQSFNQNLRAAIGNPFANMNHPNRAGRDPFTLATHGLNARQSSFQDALQAWLGARPTDATGLGGWLQALPNYNDFRRGTVGPSYADVMGTTGQVSGGINGYSGSGGDIPQNSDLVNLLRKKYGGGVLPQDYGSPAASGVPTTSG